MLKRWVMAIILLVFFIYSGLADSKPGDKEKLPEIGSIYKYDKADWIVRGIGSKAFQYKSVGESLCIIVIGIPGAIVKVPKKGAVLKVDPQVPMIYIDGKMDEQLKQNTYFMKKTKDKTFLLLEYKR